MPWRKKEKSCKDSLSGKPEGCGFTSSACDAVRALLAAGAAVDEDHALERAAACARDPSGTYEGGRAVGCWYQVRRVGISRKEEAFSPLF